MNKIIAFTNQKGGVGKSTSCINIGSILGKLGKKILIIDMDPQANTTNGLGIEEEMLKNKHTIYDCIAHEIKINDAAMKTIFDNVEIVPSSITLANAEIEISAMMGRETLLKDSFENANIDKYDFILLDLPPTLGLLTINGLTAADEIIIPVDVGVFALSGIEQLVKVIKLIKRKFNSNLSIMGVLMTKVDSRTNMSKSLYEDLKGLFGDKMFKTNIHQTVRIAEAQEKQKPINYYDSKCKGCIEYDEVTKEIIQRF